MMNMQHVFTVRDYLEVVSISRVSASALYMYIYDAVRGKSPALSSFSPKSQIRYIYKALCVETTLHMYLGYFTISSWWDRRWWNERVLLESSGAKPGGSAALNKPFASTPIFSALPDPVSRHYKVQLIYPSNNPLQ